jgi:hypothetical protein
MVTGRHPFEGPTASHVVVAILDKQADPVSAYAPGVPDELQKILAKAMDKDRDKRYQSVKDMQVDLKRLREYLHGGPEKPRRWRTSVGAAAAVLAVAAGAFVFAVRRTPALTARDTVLLTDFVNSTGDAVFDGTLKQGLAVQLEQSPFLDILSAERVRETLGLMDRASDARVTRDIGREICQRLGVKALIEGSISSLGIHYVLALEAISAPSGDTIARQQVEAESKERILRALGEAATQLRGKLGESLASIRKYDASLEQATTSSLEALKALSMSLERDYATDYRGAALYAKRAVELDPNFASVCVANS